MALFSKKPKPTAPEASAAAPQSPAPASTPPARLPRKVNPAEFLALRNELVDVRARLEASEQAKAVVEARLAALDATTTAIATGRLGGDELKLRISDLEGQLQGVSAATAAASAAAEQAAHKANAASTLATAHHSTPDPVLAARVEALAARVEALPDPAVAPPAPVVIAAPAPAPLDPAILERLDALSARAQAIDALSAQVAELQAKAAEPVPAPAPAPEAPAPVEPPAPVVDPALVAQVAQLAERIAATDTTTRQAVDLVNTLQQRLTSVSTELANQVRELGTDIDGLAAHQESVAKGTVDDEVITALQTAQVRLAAEQARYEIAFRQDLAALAEQVRRSPKG